MRNNDLWYALISTENKLSSQLSLSCIIFKQGPLIKQGFLFLRLLVHPTQPNRWRHVTWQQNIEATLKRSEMGDSGNLQLTQQLPAW